MAHVVDQQNTSGTIGVGFGDTGNGREYMAQGFIPAQSNVSAVAFYIHGKSGNGNVGYKVWIDNADASFFPTGTVGVGIGGATEITNASLVTGALTQYILSSPVTVTPGNRYAICFAPWNTSTHAWVSEYQDWRTSVSNPYANGRRVHANGSFASWSAPDSGNADIQFRTYYDDTLGASVIKTVSGVTRATIKVLEGVALAAVKKFVGQA